ncbi:hypothetical protein J437_LFUL008730 [Ladona fulva]|uniref:Uncharacterized protein n=1 Tax=Ladona fulva TaxID=123851 RepID=A0A8K0K776_LADFU|nr:hypothetical protein J437_LFUL008730 [Ladona fulva]
MGTFKSRSGIVREKAAGSVQNIPQKPKTVPPVFIYRFIQGVNAVDGFLPPFSMYELVNQARGEAVECSDFIEKAKLKVLPKDPTRLFQNAVKKAVRECNLFSQGETTKLTYMNPMPP